MKVADYIYHDLRAKIDSGMGPPAELTIAALAEHYQVSYTPVRMALKRLIDDGWIVKQPNGRLLLQSRGSTEKASEVKPPEPPKDWDAIIAADLVRRSLLGDQGFIREEATAEKYGVGRTVIRQVFGRLAGRGLLEFLPRRGWQIHPFRERDLEDYLEVREVLELKALELAFPQLQVEQLQLYLQANSPDEQGNARLDDSLHRYWIDLSGNRYIRDFFDRYGAYFSAVSNQAAEDLSLRRESAAEHQQILQALLSKDLRSAKQALSKHILRQRANVAAFFRLLHEQAPKFTPATNLCDTPVG